MGKSIKIGHVRLHTRNGSYQYDINLRNKPRQRGTLHTRLRAEAIAHAR